MRADDRHSAWLRAVITGQQEDAQRLAGEIFAAGAAEPVYPFLHCAFAAAIRQFFGGSYTRDRVIGLVAAVRAGLSGTPADGINPVAAESEILRALGDTNVPLFPDGDARAVAQAALFSYTVHAMALDDGQIGELLRQARQMAADVQAG